MPYTLLELLMLAATLSTPTENPAMPHCPSAPLTVTLTGPDALQGLGVNARDVPLQLVIERATPDEVPLTVTVTLPNGVTLVDDDVRRTIVDPASKRLVHGLQLRLRQLQPGDVVVTVSAQSRTWGAQATAVYRFGRSAPTPTPTIEAPLHGPNGVVLARPVPLANSPAAAMRPSRPRTPAQPGPQPPLGAERAR